MIISSSSSIIHSLIIQFNLSLNNTFIIHCAFVSRDNNKDGCTMWTCKADKFTAGVRLSLCLYLELFSNSRTPICVDAHFYSVHLLNVTCLLFELSAEKWRKTSAVPYVGFLQQQQQLSSFCLCQRFDLVYPCHGQVVVLFFSSNHTCCLMKLGLLSFGQMFHEILEWNSLCLSFSVVLSATFSLFLEQMFALNYCAFLDNPSAMSENAKHFVLLLW